jgi:multidrug resistance efflux pump
VVAAGGVALVGSLLGARLLGPGGGGGTDAAGKFAPGAGKDAISTVVLGTADSDPGPVDYALPPILQSGRVAEVFVHQGDEVKAGDRLYRFDSKILEAKLVEAERAVDSAKAKLAEAQGAADLHATAVALQAETVKAAETSVRLAREAWQVGEWHKKEYYKSTRVPTDRWPELLKNEPELFDLYVKHARAEAERDLAKAKLDAVKAAQEKQLARVVAVAEAEVKRHQAAVDEARTAVEMCTVRAEQDGTVARVLAGKGGTMGVGSRAPALILIPAGPRVVRAEVEAEFAYRIGTNQIGRAVTIHDFTDPKVSYQGRVRGPLGDAFLPRRGSEGALIQNETRVLEVVIEVPDAAPPGKPPLRVGQRVRVNFSP